MIDRACEDKWYRTSKFIGAVRYNVPRICATRVCRACADETACVAVRYPTLRIGRRKGRTRSWSVRSRGKILCRSPISKRSLLSDFRRAIKQGKGRSSKRKGNRRCPFLFVPAADAAVSHAPQSAAYSLGNRKVMQVPSPSALFSSTSA